jgi:hypothetical protein
VSEGSYPQMLSALRGRAPPLTRIAKAIRPLCALRGEVATIVVPLPHRAEIRLALFGERLEGFACFLRQQPLLEDAALAL